MSGDAVRLLVLWCPYWPVVAACAATGTPPLAPAAVFSANRVVTCSVAARRSGVTRGMHRRDARTQCPELVVHQHDPDRDARLFEPVATAVGAHAVRQAEGPHGCTLALAADDTTLVYINAATADEPEAGPWQHDPCGAAKKIAALTVNNLTA